MANATVVPTKPDDLKSGDIVVFRAHGNEAEIVEYVATPDSHPTDFLGRFTPHSRYIKWRTVRGGCHCTDLDLFSKVEFATG